MNGSHRGPRAHREQREEEKRTLIIFCLHPLWQAVFARKKEEMPKDFSVLKYLPYFVITLALSLGGQGLLKKGLIVTLGGVRPTPGEYLTIHLWSLFTSPYVWAGIGLCGVGVVAWMYVLSLCNLSQALPILGGLAYVAMFFYGKLFLNEEPSWLNFAGILVIILGLFLVSLKTQT